MQQASIIAAAPFLIVMIAMCYALFKELRAEQLPDSLPAPPEPERASSRPTGAPCRSKRARRIRKTVGGKRSRADSKNPESSFSEVCKEFGLRTEAGGEGGWVEHGETLFEDS